MWKWLGSGYWRGWYYKLLLQVRWTQQLSECLHRLCSEGWWSRLNAIWTSTNSNSQRVSFLPRDLYLNVNRWWDENDVRSTKKEGRQTEIVFDLHAFNKGVVFIFQFSNFQFGYYSKHILDRSRRWFPQSRQWCCSVDRSVICWFHALRHWWSRWWTLLLC